MTIQSQLDQVLAPCPFCGGEAAIHTTRTSDSEFIRLNNRDTGYGVNCIECGGTTRSPGSVVGRATKAEAIAAWNKRAAVGGEAVAVVEQTAPEGLYARFIGAGRIYTVTPGAKLYASPTATVDVGALLEYCDELRARADQADGEIVPGISGKEIVLLRDIADELAALIGEKA